MHGNVGKQVHHFAERPRRRVFHGDAGVRRNDSHDWHEGLEGGGGLRQRRAGAWLSSARPDEPPTRPRAAHLFSQRAYGSLGWAFQDAAKGHDGGIAAAPVLRAEVCLDKGVASLDGGAGRA